MRSKPRREHQAIGGTTEAEAICEQDFLPCSYGYRPLVGARTAVEELRVKLQFGGYHYLVEADIKGFFDHLSHAWLMRMLAERIDDEPFLRLIKKWLKAGVLDTDGKVLRPESGTPQGGIKNYYGVSGNSASLDEFFYQVRRIHQRGLISAVSGAAILGPPTTN
jgi:retron-type reverse transcriptase